MNCTRIAKRGLPMVLVLLAVALPIGGCGGGSSAGSAAQADAHGGTAAKPSAGSGEARFIVKADAVCGRINKKIEAIKAKSASPGEVKRIIPLTLSIEQHGLVALEQLEPPASLARDWRRMLGYRQTLARELAQLLELARKNDGTSLKPLSASKKRVHNALAKAAAADGFRACAKIGGVGVSTRTGGKPKSA